MYVSAQTGTFESTIFHIDREKPLFIYFVSRSITRGKQHDELQLLVANLLPDAIPGNKLGRATSCVGGALLVDWMACP